MIGKKRENCSIEPTSFSTSISFNYLLLEAALHRERKSFTLILKNDNFFFFSYCKHHQHILYYNNINNDHMKFKYGIMEKEVKELAQIFLSSFLLLHFKLNGYLILFKCKTAH